jgi:hypothetical protein
MRYTNKELVIINVLADLQAVGRKMVCLDEIVTAARPNLDPQHQQKFFRSGINSCIRNLRLKLPKEGLELVPNETVGRGNKAEFRITGDYRKLINQQVEEQCQSIA